MPLEEFFKIRTKKYAIPRVPLPDISYKMPELTFTRLRKHRVVEFLESNDNTANDVILEELKQDIKTEAESETEGDPELATVLEALSNSDKVAKVEMKPVTAVPKTLYMNQHTFQAKVNEMSLKESQAVK